VLTKVDVVASESIAVSGVWTLTHVKDVSEVASPLAVGTGVLGQIPACVEGWDRVCGFAWLMGWCAGGDGSFRLAVIL